jgi:hypothetical protein
MPGATGPEALAALAPLATAPGVTAHSGPYPKRYAGSPFTEFAGLVWVDRSQIGALAGARPLSYTLNLSYADPRASTSFTHDSTGGIEYTSWKEIAYQDGKLVKQAHLALLVGSCRRRAGNCGGCAGRGGTGAAHGT